MLERIRRDYPGWGVVLVGDWNAHIGDLNQGEDLQFTDSFLTHHRSSRDAVIDAWGRKLVDFMESYGFMVINGRSKGDKLGEYTFHGARGCSVVDQCWVNSEALRKIRDFEVGSELGVLSDHSECALTLEAPQNVSRPQRSQRSTTKIKWKPEKIAVFRSTLAEELRDSPSLQDDVEEYYASFKSSVQAALSRAGMIMKIWTNNMKKPDKPWYTQECRESKRQVRRALKRWKTKGESINNYLECKKAYVALIKRMKIQYFQGIRDRLTSARNSQDWWATIKEVRFKEFKVSPIDPGRWESFLEATYPPVGDWSDCTPDLEIVHPNLNEPFTKAEINKALTHLKNNKAPGVDQIPNEVWKNLEAIGLDRLLTLFNKILLSGAVPQEWGEVLLKMIPKTADVEDPAKHRPIALIQTIVKCFTYCVCERILEWAEMERAIPEAQAGFRRGRGCRDNVFVLSSLIGLRLQRSKGKLFCAFVDYRDAFGSVPHNMLWYVLSEMGIRGSILRVLSSLYSHARAAVKTEDGVTSFFRVTRGVLQGDSCSPVLFSLYLSGLDNYIRSRGFGGINVDGSNDIMTLCYADDLCILGDSKTDIEGKLGALFEFSESMGLKLNPEKTKVVLFGKRGGMGTDLRYLVGTDSIQGASEYIYLGVPFASSGIFAKAQTRFRSKALAAWGAARQTLMTARLDHWDSIERLMDALVESVLLYNAEVWGVRYMDELESVQARLLKNVLMLPRSTPGYLLRLETGRSRLSVKILDRAMSWLVRLLRMPPDRYPRMCYDQMLETMRRGTSHAKYNWAHQIRDLLVGIGYSDVWERQDGEEFARLRKEIRETCNMKHVYDDFARALTSSYSDLYRRLRFDGSSPEAYLTSDASLRIKRVMAQLRLSSQYLMSGWIDGAGYKIEQRGTCFLCNWGVAESLEHIFCHCTALATVRLRFFGTRRASWERVVNCLLSGLDVGESQMVTQFFLTYLRRRAYEERLLVEAGLMDE
ncbi:Reverse transcriptase (RNA-dependent DNA polymerase) [Nesidiocoris tenuis]|uniref:Reverse transcriptase (RNA-dependent DNA polymerase) n=2 Tax=Nesidiocoris tenuis TaxID=355587 RepID=A0ABN7BFY1_9HEMI|nr:Reverse transcriptase (RNA-dependent DNA polymerase) [Nesidiocoris tenuis]